MAYGSSCMPEWEDNTTVLAQKCVVFANDDVWQLTEPDYHIFLPVEKFSVKNTYKDYNVYRQ